MFIWLISITLTVVDNITLEDTGWSNTGVYVEFHQCFVLPAVPFHSCPSVVGLGLVIPHLGSSHGPGTSVAWAAESKARVHLGFGGAERLRGLELIRARWCGALMGGAEPRVRFGHEVHRAGAGGDGAGAAGIGVQQAATLQLECLLEGHGDGGPTPSGVCFLVSQLGCRCSASNNRTLQLESFKAFSGAC